MPYRDIPPDPPMPQVEPFTLSGRLDIDEYDAYDEWGIWVTGELESLIQWPKMKPVTENTWQESDGVETDLSDPKLASRNLTLKFAMKDCSVTALKEFVAYLKSSVYHTFTFNSLGGRTYALRLLSYASLDYAAELGFLAVKFADDTPLPEYEYLAPVSSIESLDEYKIDGKKLTDYGVRVLQGSLSEVLKHGNIKEAMKRDIKVLNGVIYDDEAEPKYKSRDVKLKCLMRAATILELWQNWDALLFDLTKPDERILYAQGADNTPEGMIIVPQPGQFYCYYKSCQVTTFYPTDKIWLEFTLTLCFTYRQITAPGPEPDEL